MIDTSNPKQREKTKPDTKFLRDIALFLEGWKFAKGDISPLGTMNISVLWDAIKFINESQPR